MRTTRRWWPRWRPPWRASPTSWTLGPSCWPNCVERRRESDWWARGEEVYSRRGIHHGPKNKEDKILMMMDEEEKKRTKKKENRNSPKGSNARSPTYRLDETFAEVICLPAKVADCIERAILVVCACLVRLYMTRLRMGKIDLYSRTSKRASF